MINVLLVDDQAMVRDGLRAILASDPEIKVVAALNNGADAVAAVTRQAVDVVLMDLKMPIMGGVEATRQIRQQRPGTRILILTTYATDELLFDAIRAGASGYLLKDADSSALLSAIKGTHAGNTYVDPAVAGRLFAAVKQPSSRPASELFKELSERESDVLALLACGLDNASIAAELRLSEGTVRNYVSTLLAKLGVTDRTKAAILAVQHGIVRK